MCLVLTIQCALLSPQGKEFETRLKEKKPGDLSDELRISLGMPVGPVSASVTWWDTERRAGIGAEGRQRGRVGPMVFRSLFPAERPQSPSPVADRHAAIRTTPVVPELENPWAELPHP